MVQKTGKRTTQICENQSEASKNKRRIDKPTRRLHFH